MPSLRQRVVVTSCTSFSHPLRPGHESISRPSLNIKCLQCNKTFSKASNLSRHVKWFHTKETFSCSACAKKLMTPKSWAIHETSVCKVGGWSEERLKEEFNVTLVPCPFQGCEKLFDQDQSGTLKRFDWI